MARQSSSIKGILEFKEFCFAFEKKKLKYLRLRIDRDLNFKLSIPLYYEQRDVLRFLEKNESWIRAKEKELSLKRVVIASDELYFLGRKYKLAFDENYKKVFIKKGKIFAKSQKALDLFLRRSARVIFEFYIKKWEFAFERKVQRICIKEMISRWGSCNHQKAYINLNLKLMQKPIKAIEYVILHELTHLIYPHHQKEFYDFLYKLMPDYKACEALLKSFIY
ncbi:M48 family metallopeptidase [Campylobacter lari]|uniref:M48 family metallopeptidase n=1 Tax=Campylobacter lari TaxID=201 RepID=A0A6L1KY62_CAMLA|nr:M48 family metallopeptidase [Campylobacter lari]